MKRIALFALFLLITAGLQGQEYKPLGKVDVPDYPATIIRVSERELIGGGTCYTSSHSLGTRTISAELGVPPLYDIGIKMDTDIPQGATAVVNIGGDRYYMNVSFVNDKHIYIDIVGDHIKHLAVSGMQSIDFLVKGQSVHKIEFGMVEQELWRRAAVALMDTLDKFKIL